MSYAIRNDGQGWRAVNSADDIGDGETFAEQIPEPAALTVVAHVSALQGLLAIDQAGLSEAYDEWANSPARTFAERAFIEKAQTWKRNDPTLNAAATDLGLTSEQVDQLFILAATL